MDGIGGRGKVNESYICAKIHYLQRNRESSVYQFLTLEWWDEKPRGNRLSCGGFFDVFLKTSANHPSPTDGSKCSSQPSLYRQRLIEIHHASDGVLT